MTRIALACPEPLAHGQPAGVGIRFLEIARVLRDDGHDVTLLSPDAGTIDGCRGALIGPAELEAAATAFDMIVVQGHVANALFAAAPRIPVVVDLYDPFVVENFHYYGERGPEVFLYDHNTLMTSIAQGDFFLCASEAQRLFYLGILLAAGRLNPAIFDHDPELRLLISLAPFGVPPARERRAPDLPSPAILFGGIYDWYDPVAAIETVAIVRKTIPGATLTFTHHPNPGTTPQGKLAEAMRHARERRFDFVRFEPWAPYDERAQYFERFTLALLTFPRSIETDLAMRTRIYDYLWCGLPVVSSSAPGTDEILLRYDAGSPLAGEDPVTFASEVVSILKDRERHSRMVDGARRFVADHQWTDTLAPLREFCRSPRVAAHKDLFAASIAITGRPSILDRIRRRLRA